MSINIVELFLTFMIYSFIGYLCEVIYCSLYEKKFVNRGFLCGPCCPIYGVGGIFITLLLKRFEDDPIVIFILGAVITSALEYFTSFILEKVFHNKWWDYNDGRLNINGRVCLQNTLLFGFGSMAGIYIGYPCITKTLDGVSDIFNIILASILLLIFICDCVYSFIIAYNLRNRIIICEELKNQKIAKIPGMLERILKEKASKFKAYPRRLLEAFPNLKKANYKEFELMKKIRDKNIKLKKKKKNNS